MKERDDFLKNEEISTLNQLTESLEEAGMKLEEAYKNNNSEEFNKSKKLILQIQKKILEIAR